MIGTRVAFIAHQCTAGSGGESARRVRGRWPGVRTCCFCHAPPCCADIITEIPIEGPYTGRCSRQDLHSGKRIFSQMSQRSAADAAAPCIFFCALLLSFGHPGAPATEGFLFMRPEIPPPLGMT